MENKKEWVNHPTHYQSKNGMEVIDVIDNFELNFNLGNAVKYILRCGKKDNDIQELNKAIWYINHEIELRTKNANINTNSSYSERKLLVE